MIRPEDAKQRVEAAGGAVGRVRAAKQQRVAQSAFILAQTPGLRAARRRGERLTRAEDAEGGRRIPLAARNCS